MCKKRLQRIKKQLSGTKVVELHDHASPDAVRVVTTVLRDSQYLAAVDEARAKLKSARPHEISLHITLFRLFTVEL